MILQLYLNNDLNQGILSIFGIPKIAFFLFVRNLQFLILYDARVCCCSLGY